MKSGHFDALPGAIVTARDSLPFGVELRRIRIARGLSLAGMARLVHYSKGYISRIETGLRRPSVTFARLCDSMLETDGTLLALATEQLREPAELSGHERSKSKLIDTVPESLILQLSGDDAAIDSFETLFVEFRRMGRLVSSHRIDRTLAQQTQMLEAAAAQANGALRRRLFGLSARFAEYAGWMFQESGAEHEALAWTAKAAQVADANGDAVMGVQAMVRRALFALYRGDAHLVIALAAEASNSPSAPTWLRAQALQRQAQGHALAGESEATRRALDRAAELAANADQPDSGLRLGPTTVPDLVAVNSAWCLVDLGQGDTAAEILNREISKLPEDARRPRARIGTRRALAHAVSGSVEQACLAVHQILPDVTHIQSATINSDVARLYRTLMRWQRRGDVGDVLPRLGAVLRAGALLVPESRMSSDEQRS